VLNINRINIDKNIHTAKPLGLEDPITALAKPCMVSGILRTSTNTFILLNLRKYIINTSTAKTNELDLKKM
jgi:hypothetical protein